MRTRARQGNDALTLILSHTLVATLAVSKCIYLAQETALVLPVLAQATRRDTPRQRGPIIMFRPPQSGALVKARYGDVAEETNVGPAVSNHVVHPFVGIGARLTRQL